MKLPPEIRNLMAGQRLIEGALGLERKTAWVNVATGKQIIFAERMTGFSHYSGKASFYTDGIGWQHEYVTAELRPI